MKKILLILSLFIMSCMSYSIQNVKSLKITDAWSSCVKTRPQMASNWCEGPLRKITVVVVNPFQRDHTVVVECKTQSNSLFGKMTFLAKANSKTVKVIYGLDEVTGFRNSVVCTVE